MFAIRNYKKELKQVELRAQAAEKSLQHLQLRAIGDTAADDIFVTGYPKSGNTWLQIMLAAIVFNMDVSRTPFTLVCEALPDLSDREFYRRHAAQMFFKSHALPAPNHKRVVYILRDGRDVMVSYRHYREVVDRRTYDLEQFVSKDSALWPCHWSDHVEAWAANPFKADIIFVRYEDLIKNPVPQLQRICRFANLLRSDKQLQAVVDGASMDRLRAKEKREGSIPVVQYSGEKPFFRRGEIGSHRDEMPAAALAAFMEHARPTLERWGYADTAPGTVVTPFPASVAAKERPRSAAA